MHNDFQRKTQNILMEKQTSIATNIHSLTLDRINEMNSREHLRNLVHNFSIHPPKLLVKQMRNEFSEIDHSHSKKLRTVVFYIPFEEDDNLLRNSLSGESFAGREVVAGYNKTISFEIEDEDDELIKRHRQETVNALNSAVDIIRQLVENYNNQLHNYVTQTFDQHLQKLMRDKKRLNDLLR